MAKRPPIQKDARKIAEHDQRAIMTRRAMENSDTAWVDNLLMSPRQGKDGALLALFVSRMHEGWDYWRENWAAASEDMKFAYDEDSQWDGKALAERREAGRPALSLNLMPQYINQVVGMARQSRMSISVVRKGGVDLKVPLETDPSKRLGYSEIMSGMIRDIEQRSMASAEYQHALQHAVEGGFGWLMAELRVPRDDPLGQEIVIRHIRDRYGVMFDPFSERRDLSDARWAAISKLVEPREFAAKYPDAKRTGGSIADWGVGGETFHGWWGEGERIRVTDYWYFEPEDRVVQTWRHPVTGEDFWCYADDIEAVEDDMKRLRFRKEDEESKVCEVLYKCRVTGFDVLERPVRHPGAMIPIVPVLGRQVDRRDRRLYLSLTRFARHAQQMVNVWASAATERVALSPKAPYIASKEQLAGHEEEWQRNTYDNLAVLMYNHVEGIPPPKRDAIANMPVAELQMLEVGRQMVMETTGVSEAVRGVRSNETSGTAIQRRQDAGSVGVSEFVDNLGHSVGVLGTVLCQMIPDVYDGDRLADIVLPDDTQAQVHLGHLIRDEESGDEFTLGNLRLGRYRCLARVGAFVQSERELMLNMLLDFIRTVPNTAGVIADKIFEAVDVPGARAIAERLRRIIPPQVLSAQEREALGEQPPSPEAQAQQLQAQADMAGHQAKMAKAESDALTAQTEEKIARVNLEIAEARKKEAEAKAFEDRGAGADSEGDLDRRIEAKTKAALADALAGGGKGPA